MGTGKIVLFEGCDYSGKSSVAKALAASNSNGFYYHTPAGTTNTTATLHKTLRSCAPDINPDVKLLLMLTANILGINAMNALKHEHKWDVYADRSILSMLVYQSVLTRDFEEMKTLFSVPTLDADRVFLFTADKEVLCSRHRERNSDDKLDEFFMDNIDIICDRYMKLTSYVYPVEKTIIVDTSHKHIEDVARFCQHAI